MYVRLIHTILLIIAITFYLALPQALIYAKLTANNQHQFRNGIQFRIEKLWNRTIKIKDISSMTFYKISISNIGNIFVLANIREPLNLSRTHSVEVLSTLYALNVRGDPLWSHPFRTYVKCPLVFIPFSLIYCGAYIVTNNESSIVALVGSYKVHCLNENGKILFTKKFDTMIDIVKVVDNYVLIKVANCILIFNKYGSLIWKICGNIRSFNVAPNGNIMVILFGNRKIGIYDISKKRLVKSISIPEDIIHRGFLKGSCNVYISSNTKYLAIACGYISSCSSSSLKCNYVVNVLVLSTMTGNVLLSYLRNITFSAIITIGGPPVSVSELDILSNRWFIIKLTLGPPSKTILMIFNLINKSRYELDFNSKIAVVHLYPYDTALIIYQNGRLILLDLRNRMILWRGNIPVGGKIEISPNGKYLVTARTSSLYGGIVVTAYRVKLTQSMVCDLDHNGMLDIGDVILLLKALVGAYHGNVLCDLNHNGRLDIGDVILLLEMITAAG